MKDLASRLRIFAENAGVFVDYSDALCDFSLDSATITLQSTGYLYLGFEKPITSTFIYASTASTGTRLLSASTYTSSGWTDVLAILDDTVGLTRSGLVQWALPENTLPCQVNNIDGLYWIRLKVSIATSAVVYAAISALFSDDVDLAREFPKIMDAGFLLGKTNHYLIHEGVRDAIVAKFRNRGLKRLATSAVLRRVTCWDLLDIQEVRQAATFLALSKIFDNISNSADDKDNWKSKSREYAKRATSELDIAYLTFDRISDGNTSILRDMSVTLLER